MTFSIGKYQIKRLNHSGGIENPNMNIWMLSKGFKNCSLSIYQVLWCLNHFLPLSITAGTQRSSPFSPRATLPALSILCLHIDLESLSFCSFLVFNVSFMISGFINRRALMFHSPLQSSLPLQWRVCSVTCKYSSHVFCSRKDELVSFFQAGDQRCKQLFIRSWVWRRWPHYCFFSLFCNGNLILIQMRRTSRGTTHYRKSKRRHTYIIMSLIKSNQSCYIVHWAHQIPKILVASLVISVHSQIIYQTNHMLRHFYFPEWLFRS